MTTTPSRTSRYQDAFRIWVLVDVAGTAPDELAPLAAVSMIRSQMRLQALDFWLRNPDYLADELLNEYVAGRMGADAVDHARRILLSEEPDLRRYPMVRYRFGAYEPLDDALAALRFPGYLAIRRRERGGRVGQHRYYLLSDGRTALGEVLAEAPDLEWYVRRARLIATVAGSAGGKALKDRQYQQTVYKQTPQNSRISPITEAVKRRLAGMGL